MRGGRERGALVQVEGGDLLIGVDDDRKLTDAAAYGTEEALIVNLTEEEDCKDTESRRRWRPTAVTGR